MALVDRLIPLRARLGNLPVRLGVPQYQGRVVLFHQGTYTILEPNPQVQTVSPKGTSNYFSAGTYLTDSVQILGDELIVKGVPRSYSEELLEDSTWIVDATLDENTGTWSGTRCDATFIDRNEVVTWTAVLKPRKNK